MRHHTDIGSINQHEGQMLTYSFIYNLYTKIRV